MSGSRAGDELLETRPVTPAAREFFAAGQNDHVFTAVAGLQLFDSLNIHDDGAVDAQELAGIEPRGNVADALAHQVGLAAGLQPYVVGGSFGPIDLFPL